MPTIKVTITTVCKTSNNAAQLSNQANSHNQIQWHAAGQNDSYTLHLPGGVFGGQPNDFTVVVSGSDFQPSPPLQLVSDPSKQTISNYIYQGDGNCRTEDPPPEILIETNMPAEQEHRAKGSGR